MKTMLSFSWRQVIGAVAVDIALLGSAAYAWYYVAIILPAQQSAAAEQRISVPERQVRAKVCPEVSSSTNEALRKFCGGQP